MKLVDVKQAKEFASTFFGDPILKMAVNSALDHCPSFELVRCGECSHHEDCKVRGAVWCPKMGRYMKDDQFCSEGVVKDA